MRLPDGRDRASRHGRQPGGRHRGRLGGRFAHCGGAPSRRDRSAARPRALGAPPTCRYAAARPKTPAVHASPAAKPEVLVNSAALWGRTPRSGITPVMTDNAATKLLFWMLRTSLYPTTWPALTGVMVG